ATYVTEEIFVNLAPLADGTPVRGTFDDTGCPNGVDAEWRGHFISIGYDTVYGGKASLEVQFDDESLRSSDWSKRRKDMSDLVSNNIVEQVIERARNWQPHLFT